ALSVMRHKHLKRPEIEILRSGEFHVTSPKKIDIAIDGEIIGDVNEFRVSLLKNGLNLFLPDNNSE
ncbi:MAG: hypothetical protein KAS21_10005, partial [Candidatus Aminicenantes bacterium]|nr:hypothetical protein [Candidatus Aminicenantes bacterium]